MEEELQFSRYRKIYQYNSNCGCDILLEEYSAVSDGGVVVIGTCSFSALEGGRFGLGKVTSGSQYSKCANQTQ